MGREGERGVGNKWGIKGVVRVWGINLIYYIIVASWSHMYNMFHVYSSTVIVHAAILSLYVSL